MSVTAYFGSFSFLRELGRREVRFLPECRGAARFAFRLAIMGGIVLQLAKTASRLTCCIVEESARLGKRAPNGTRQMAWCSRETQIERRAYFSASLRPASRLSKLRMVLSTSE